MRSQPVYDRVANESAALVIRRYSTSFGLSCLLLAKPIREHVRNTYALVRIADEVVDNPDPTMSVDARSRMLSALYDDVRQTIELGYSTNPVVHAFGRTARISGFGAELIDPFFESMSMDLTMTQHTQESLQTYIYGSAEVIGLMCLRIFLLEDSRTPADYESLAPGAQHLGAAFQKLNFLRDLRQDSLDLGRSYFPGVTPNTITDHDRDRILDDIDEDLTIASAALTALPPSSARAVRAAYATFSELAGRLRTTPARDIARQRIRVPDTTKLRILAGSFVQARA